MASRGKINNDVAHCVSHNAKQRSLAFTPSNSNKRFDRRLWDTYSINMINYNGRSFSVDRDIEFKAFPKSIGLSIKSKSGIPVVGADVKVYGVIMGEHRVCPNEIISGKSNSKGIFNFPRNPYLNNLLNQFMYKNVLISAIANCDTTWTWLPFYDPSNAWFKNPDTVFTKAIILSKGGILRGRSSSKKKS